jgi:hypothetical protein
MTAHSGFVELEVPNEGARSAPFVSETYWGYVIRPPEPQLERAAVIEMVAIFAGVLLFLAAYGQWLLPGADAADGVIGLKLVSTVLFAVLGGSLAWLGRRGMVQELHVDRLKSQLRLVQRNRHGEGRLTAVFAFSDIGSVVLKRSKTPWRTARLCLRLAGSGSFVEVLVAAEVELLPIRDRLIVDMSPRFRADPRPHRPSRPQAMAT